MKIKLSILFFFSFHFFSLSLLFAEQVNAPSVKMLHLFIQADINEVRFENIWVFERKVTQGPWQVSIDLPDGAVVLNFDEPNETELLAGSGTIRKKMAADSLIDSVGFSFVLPNQNGTCRTQIAPGHRVNSMVASVSGSAAKLVSDVLKFDEYRALHSRFSRVYTANNLPAGTKVGIKLAGLPSRDSGLLEILCLVGLWLIVMVALLTMYYNRKTMKVKSSANETCSV